MGSRNLVPAVSPMNGSPTFDTEKKENRKIERGEFIKHFMQQNILLNIQTSYASHF